MLIRSRARNKVERAIYEIRRGFPIVIYSKNSYLLLAAAETLERSSFDEYRLISNSGNVYLTLTQSKVRYTFQSKESGSSKRLVIKDFDDLLCLLNSLTNNNSKKELRSSNTIDKYATTLLKVSELLPYALVVDMEFKNAKEMEGWCKENDIIALNTSFIKNFQRNDDLYEVCRTSLFLKQTQEANIISYRSRSNGREYYAILIGDQINQSVNSSTLVRIHSSCYTGDLLESLSCDCGSQLHQAIQIIVDSGGGVILYLMQDGRGIGLTNKFRAYYMQRKFNLDTVDANRILGFEDDERDFTAAAEILKNLNIRKVQLLTNNVRKLSGLKDSGIEITKCLPLITEYNQYNKSYIETKFSKLGHKLKIF